LWSPAVALFRHSGAPVRSKRRLVAAAVSAVGAALVHSAPAVSATHLPAPTYSADTTWSISGSPYILDGDVTVAAGRTLTVDPGVVVKFNGSFRQLWISGALNAVGTRANPITFTSIQDDTVGGDSGGDGSTTGSPGQWYNITLASDTATTHLTYVDVEYGGWGSAAWNYGQIAVTGAGGVAIDHSTISNGQNSGVLVGTGGSVGPWPSVTISDSAVTNNANGVSVNQGALSLDGNSFVSDNSQDGVWINLTQAFNGAASTLSHSEIARNGRYGVYYQPGTGVAASVEPTAHHDDIEENISAQYSSTTVKPTLDWSQNYWGSNAYTWNNPAACAAQYPESAEHVAGDTATIRRAARSITPSPTSSRR
jgi:hypothetical protein